jgi:murein DD-endopeptidase MepM/ murein hydrolase activator NlpD
VRAGARVRQGELIGRVGSSGLATGPHLDYRLKKNGAFINPVTAHRAMPPADPIPAVQMAAFEAARDRAIAVFSKPAAAGVANPPAPTR